jgi:hypothetical protein
LQFWNHFFGVLKAFFCHFNETVWL